MVDLIRELIPHAPNLGLYLAPHIPPRKLKNAIRDYAPSLRPVDVVALFDGTLMGSAKDGILLTANRMVFQNSDLEAPHQVHYEEIVQVEQKKGMLKGARIAVHVNRGRATFPVELNLAAKPKAAEFVYRLLREVMLRPMAKSAVNTDWDAVIAALRNLRDQGALSEADYGRLLTVRHD